MLPQATFSKLPEDTDIKQDKRLVGVSLGTPAWKLSPVGVLVGKFVCARDIPSDVSATLPLRLVARLPDPDHARSEGCDRFSCRVPLLPGPSDGRALALAHRVTAEKRPYTAVAYPKEPQPIPSLAQYGPGKSG